MRQFFRTIGMKIFMYILVLLFSAAAVVGSLTCIWLSQEGLWNVSEEERNRQRLEGMAYEMAMSYLEGQYGYDGPNPNLVGFFIQSDDLEYTVRTDTQFSPARTFRFYIRHGTYNAYDDIDTTVNTDAELYFVEVYLSQSLVDQVCDGEKVLTGLLFPIRNYLIPITIAAAILTVVLLIGLLRVAGRRRNREELYPGALHKVPFDLMLGCYIIFALIGMELEFVELLLVEGCVILLLPGLCMSLAVRIKDHSLFTNTVIYRLLRLSKRCCRWLLRRAKQLIAALPLIWRTAVILVGGCILEFVLFAFNAWEPDNLILLWVAEKLLVVPVVLFAAIAMRRLQKSGEALAQGNLSHRTDTAGLFWEFRTHAENLNRISDGMTQAVEQRLKSERMKTELITNVSHDLKTPLTSLVNYATLISQEPCDNPQITEYSQVLVRQSEKLKRLIEDLVEASKAATGNLEVFPVPCDPAVFLSQAAGEYEEKLQAAGLTLISRAPEEPLRIQADSRRMWRIFDNLMNNICKYSLPGTRVFLTLERIGSTAVINFRNTAKEPLTMGAEELMERFVRGDTSRNTEGSGLGLSIARSLTELQGGSFALTVEEDLFRVTLSFPLDFGTP